MFQAPSDFTPDFSKSGGLIAAVAQDVYDFACHEGLQAHAKSAVIRVRGEEEVQ